MSNNPVSIDTRAGEPIAVKSRKIVPFAQVLNIRAPKTPLGFSWNRPASILIIDQDGREEIIDIPDVTRRIQFYLLGLGLIGSITIWITFKLVRKTRS